MGAPPTVDPTSAPGKFLPFGQTLTPTPSPSVGTMFLPDHMAVPLLGAQLEAATTTSFSSSQFTPFTTLATQLEDKVFGTTTTSASDQLFGTIRLSFSARRLASQNGAVRTPTSGSLRRLAVSGSQVINFAEGGLSHMLGLPALVVSSAVLVEPSLWRVEYYTPAFNMTIDAVEALLGRIRGALAKLSDLYSEEFMQFQRGGRK